MGKLLLRGGMLTVPVVEYIKDKYKLKSVETTERLEKELIFMYQDLIDKGFTKAQIEGALLHADPKEASKKAFKEKYEQYRSYESEYAEIKMKMALEDLKQPSSLIIRSVEKRKVGTTVCKCINK